MEKTGVLKPWRKCTKDPKWSIHNYCRQAYKKPYSRSNEWIEHSRRIEWIEHSRRIEWMEHSWRIKPKLESKYKRCKDSDLFQISLAHHIYIPSPCPVYISTWTSKGILRECNHTELLAHSQFACHFNEREKISFKNAEVNKIEALKFIYK